MPHALLSSLTASQKNVILSHRVRIDNATGVCFGFDNQLIRMTQFDAVIQTPDVPDEDGPISRNNYLADFLAGIHFYPIDSHDDMIAGVATRAMDVIVQTLRNREADLLDTFQWSLRISVLGSLNVSIDPTLRSLSPTSVRLG